MNSKLTIEYSRHKKILSILLGTNRYIKFSNESPKLIIITLYYFYSIITWAFYIIFCYSFNLPRIGAIIALFLTFNIFCIFLLRKVDNQKFHENLIISFFFVAVFAPNLNDGLGINPSMLWYMFFPIIPASLVSQRKAIIWTILASLTISTAWVIGNITGYNNTEFTESTRFATGIVNLFTGPLIIALFYSIAKKERERFIHSLSKLKSNLELEKVEKSKLLTILFHDLGRNTSLLSGYLELSGQKDLSRESKNRVLELSEEIKKVLQNAKELDSETAKTQIEEIHLLSLIQKIENGFSSIITQKNITLKLLIGDKDYVFTNKQQLKSHILENLIFNAIKFSYKNSTINITFHNKTKTLTISDSGIGMKSENQIQLGTLGERGTGNGIKITKEFCKMNNIDLLFSKNNPKGTTVSLRFRDKHTLEKI